MGDCHIINHTETVALQDGLKKSEPLSLLEPRCHCGLLADDGWLWTGCGFDMREHCYSSSTEPFVYIFGRNLHFVRDWHHFLGSSLASGQISRMALAKVG